MPQDLKVALIQANLVWENKQKNLELFAQKIDEILEPIDLIVLPEMFTTSFSMNPAKMAEKADGLTLEWLRHHAKIKNCVITGSYIVEDNHQYFNRLLWVFPDGTFQKYDKRHLFRMGNEHEMYSAGFEKIIVEWKGWRFLPLICYDLRFPVWSRGANDYDVLIYVANFPAARSHVWKTLTAARAIENQCYVLAVNRIGEDFSGVKHSGDSVIINPKGFEISKATANKEETLAQTLSFADLEKLRKNFPVYLDGDKFQIIFE